MDKRERILATLTIGLPLSYLVLLETGLVHQWNPLAVALSAVVLVGCIAAAWWWLRWWSRR